MGYALREGISFCRVGTRHVFLDMPADRYFCLDRDAERGFAGLAAGMPLSPEDEPAVARMAADGLLVPVPGQAQPQACLPPPAIIGSLLDEPHPPSIRGHVTPALLTLGRETLALRFGSLQRSLDGVARAKIRRRPRRVAGPAAVAAAFHRLGLVVASYDQCLPRSIAVAQRLAAIGWEPTLVLGVNLGPFRAHCWVQLDTMLVNDRVDTVANFTPILVV